MLLRVWNGWWRGKRHIIKPILRFQIKVDYEFIIKLDHVIFLYFLLAKILQHFAYLFHTLMTCSLEEGQCALRKVK